MAKHSKPGAEGAGLLVVDKPAGWTSHDVVGRARRLLGTRRVGHAGTLDPMATGVLVLGVERATKLLGLLSLTTKAYTTTVRLGVATSTDDAEGEVLARHDASGLTDAAVLAGVAALTGELAQVPATVSAIKVDGRRAYARAREGEVVELAARPVTVSAFEVLALRRGDGVLDVDARVECSTGTYVRALARDLGDGLGVGGHLTALRRTRVGPFDLAAARTLDQLAEDPALSLDLDAAVRAAFAVRTLDDAEAADLSHGRRLPGTGMVGVHAGVDAAGRTVALLEESGAGPGAVARPVFVVRPAGAGQAGTP